MSSVAQTPQRPLPGAYLQTPTVGRYQTSPANPLFSRAPAGLQQPNRSVQISSKAVTQPSQQSGQPNQNGQFEARSATETVNPITRASKSINETLDQELRYPELDTYLGRR